MVKSGNTPMSNRHGSARFMTMEEKERHFSSSSSGIHIGGNWIYSDQGHVMVVGGSRAGKGTRVLMQNLLTGRYDGSIIVIDPKGEYATMTAKYQRDILGKRVHIIDPWGLQDGPKITHGIQPETFNPLNILDENNPELADDCDLIADLIVPQNPNERDSHFSDKARQMISSYLLQMVSYLPKEEVTLFKLRSLFRQSSEETLSWLDKMIQNYDHLHGDVIRDNGKELFNFLENGEREAASVLSTAQKFTDVFKSAALRQTTSRSDFDMRDITKQQEVIYICIPPDRLNTHFGFLRLMVGNIITTIQRHHGNRVMMMLEEFHTLGHMKLIETSIALMAGYNLQLVPVVQDLNQLKKAYGDAWESFVANTAVQCFLGVEDLFTAEYVSRKLGNTTGYHSKRNKNDELIEEHWQRALKTPDEVMAVPAIIVFSNLGRPFLTTSIPYYIHRGLRGHYAPNPLLSMPQTFEEQWADASARAELLKDKGVMDFPEYGFSIKKQNGKLKEIDLRPPASDLPKYPGWILGGVLAIGVIFLAIWSIQYTWNDDVQIGFNLFMLAMILGIAGALLWFCYYYMRYKRWPERR